MWTFKNRFVTAGLVALTIAGTTIATTSQAEARNNFGRGFAAGIAGTLVGGALLSAVHNRPVYSTPVYTEPAYYGPPPVVYEPVYPRCHVAWRQDGFGDMYRVRVCD